ncbi:MAG: hypothetical protein ACQEQ0_08925 [Bacteroidota bacterium]
MKKNIVLIVLSVWLIGTGSIVAQKAPTNRWMFIQSAQEYGESDKGYWDVPGYPEGIGAGDVQNIQVYQKEVEPDRQFNFMNRGGNRYDIAVGHAANSHLVKWEPSLKKNGVNVRIEGKTGDGSDEIYNRQQFTLKYVGAGRWKIYSDDGRIMCLAGKSSENSSNVHLWEDHEGLFTEWHFIDAKTGEVIYPEFDSNIKNTQAESSISDQKIQETLAQMDRTYNALYTVEKKVFNNMLDIVETKITIERSFSVVNDFDDLNNQVYAAEKATLPLAKIPFVKIIFSPVNDGLGHLGTALDKTNEKVAEIGKNVVFPTQERYNKTKEGVYGSESRLAHAMDVIKKMKSVYVQAARAATMAGGNTLTQFVSYAPALNKELKRMENIANSMTKNYEEIQKLNAAIKDRQDPIDKTYSKLRKIAASLEETSDASREIKDFMEKEHDVPGGSRISSLDDLLDASDPEEGDNMILGKFIDEMMGKVRGKIGDMLGFDIPDMPASPAAAQEMYKKFVREKLGVDDMSFPIVDEFQKEMKELQEKSEKVTESNTRLMSQNTDMKNATATLRTPFENSLACIPYEYLKQAKLTELSVK